MKRHPMVLGLCAALFLLGADSARASDPELDPYSNRIETVARELIEEIRPTLDSETLAIVESIDVKSPLSWVTNARADRTIHRRRVVEFNAGLLAVTDWLALAMIAEHEGHAGCLDEYSEYLVHIARKNSKRILRGVAHAPISDFEEYALTTRGQCAQAHVEVSNERNVAFRERILDGVIATVVLHEIAHHVLGHVDSKNRGFVYVHMGEAAADQWAIRVASKVDYDLRAAVPLFLFLAASGGGSLEDDIRSTHPSGLRRVRDLLIQTRTLMEEKDAASAHLMDASIEVLNRSLLN